MPKLKLYPNLDSVWTRKTLRIKGYGHFKLFFRLERQRPGEIWKGVKHFVYNIRELTIENPVNPYQN